MRAAWSSLWQMEHMCVEGHKITAADPTTIILETSNKKNAMDYMLEMFVHHMTDKYNICGSGTAWNNDSNACESTSAAFECSDESTAASQGGTTEYSWGTTTSRKGTCACSGNLEDKTKEECQASSCVWSSWSDTEVTPMTGCSLSYAPPLAQRDKNVFTCTTGIPVGLGSDTRCIPRDKLKDYYCHLTCLQEKLSTPDDIENMERVCGAGTDRTCEEQCRAPVWADPESGECKVYINDQAVPCTDPYKLTGEAETARSVFRAGSGVCFNYGEDGAVDYTASVQC